MRYEILLKGTFKNNVNMKNPKVSCEVKMLNPQKQIFLEILQRIILHSFFVWNPYFKTDNANFLMPLSVKGLKIIGRPLI